MLIDQKIMTGDKDIPKLKDTQTSFKSKSNILILYFIKQDQVK